MATDFPTFVDVPEGTTPEPGTPDCDAEFLNAISGAVNIVENQLPAKVNTADLATVATTGAYTDLVGTPFIPTVPADIGAQPAGTYVVPADLATVATTGSYDDLTNKPTIPAGYTDEQAIDALAVALVGGDGVTVTPDDEANTITIAATGGSGAVDSVNGQTGVVVLDPADVGAAAAVHTHEVSDLNITGTPDGEKFLRDDGVWAAPTVEGVTTRTQTFSATPTIDPAIPGDRVNMTATGDVTSYSVSTTGAADGQVLQVVVLASGGIRAVTFSSAIRTTTGVGRGPHSIPSGQLLRAAVEYSTLISAWALIAVTVTAS